MKTRRITITLVLAIAFAPVFLWYSDRLSDGSGEPLGLIALAAALGLAIKDRSPGNPRCAEIALIIYGIGFFFLPPLLRAIPALLTIAFLTGMHHRAGKLALLFLSLPIQASMDFFLGFPFRVITAEGSRMIFSFFGISVERYGVQLSLGSALVSVDPPCSGLQMLWATAFLTAILAALFKLNYPRSISLGLAALLLCILANIFRATFLAIPEARLIAMPGFLHAGIGLFFFTLAGIALVKLASWFHVKHSLTPTPPRPLPLRLTATAFGVSLITLLPANTGRPSSENELPIQTEYRGRQLEEVPLSSREESFARNFPGQLKIYQAGNDTLILRHVTRATRMLHPSYHCLKAEGFSISHSRLERDHNGHPMATYQAKLNQEHYFVSEIIRSSDSSRYWTDVCAWYWHALFHPNSGPWVAETLLTPINLEPKNESS
ncbi:MAG: exosortase/archaeosortase family protein [Akkermansiaceae bacterium]